MHPTPVETTISSEAIERFSRLHSGQTTPEDYDRFEAWCKRSPEHGKAYEDVEKFWTLLNKPAKRVFDLEEAQTRRYHHVGLPGRNSPSPLINRLQYRIVAGLALAAALVTYVWLPGAISFWTSDYHTPWGERRELTLEDGSQISLNTHSALSVEFSPEQRVIKLLEGEAYFRVTHDPARPFIVATAHGLAKVAGTAFNLYVQAEQMNVTVFEGRVRVYTEGAEDRAVDLTVG